MNHDDNNKSSMMWMMVICCAIPLIILFFLGSTLSSVGYFWPILIGVFALVCIGMMFRGHGHGTSDEEHHDMIDMKQQPPEKTAGEDEKKNHSGHSCCH